MTRIMVRIVGGICIGMCTSLLSAQQTFQSYSLLDEGGTLLSDQTKTLELLNDKNDSTAYSASFTGQNWIVYEASQPLVVTTSLLVPSDKQSAAPKSFRVEASVDGQNWTRIISALGVVTKPREALLNRANGVNAYNFFRLTVQEVVSGTDMEIAEWQLLGYPKADIAANLITEANKLTGQYADNSSLKNLISDKTMEVFKQNGVQSCWIEYALDTPQKIEGYSVMTGNSTTSSPRSWELLGSNDREAWEVLDSRSNVSLQAANNMQMYELGRDREKYDWGVAADLAQQSMLDHFWETYGSGHYLIHGWHPNSNLSKDGFNYWWMAHVIDVFVDAYQRTGDKVYRKNALEVYNAMLSYGKKTYGNSSLWNGFFDDMEWMGLACLRADAVWGSDLEQRWKTGAIQLWDWIKVGWNDNHGGGIQWNDASPESKNACSNAPAAILAAQLYSMTQNKEYLDWAEKIWEWTNSHLVFDNGIIKDAYLNDDFGWTFTYNQGTWMGACLELYKITGDQKYYDAAVRTGDYVVNDWTKFSPDGILDNGEGQGDGGLFKGILMRNLSQWILSGKLDPIREQHYTQYMLENAKGLWDAATLKPEIIFKNNWRERPERVLSSSTDGGKRYDASTHLSGTMLFELMDELQRKGKISVDNQNPESVSNKENAYKYYRLVLKSVNSGQNLELSRWQLFAENTTGLQQQIGGVDVDFSIFTEKEGVVIVNKEEAPLLVQIYTVGGCLVDSVKIMVEREHIQLTSGFYLVDIFNGRTSFRKKIYVM